MKRVPVQPRFLALTADGHPQLLGSYSPRAGCSFFPRQRICPITFGPVEDRILSSRGVLYSWTYIYEERVGTQVWGAGGYGVGQIDLPEGPRIQARLIGNMGDWLIGAPMQLDVLAAPPPKSAEANVAYVTFAFRPAGATT